MRSRSSSNTSSKSSTPLSPDNISIFVKLSGGKTITLNVLPGQKIETILAFLNASELIPADAKLLHAGRSLELQKTIGELNIQPQSTLQLLSPLRGGTSPTDPESTLENSQNMTASLSVAESKVDVPTPQQTAPPERSETSTPTTSTSTPASSTPTTATRKSNKPRCAKDGCKAPIQPIVGECGFCQKRFCGKHRMLESHACSGLDDARQADKDRNAAKLEGERTVMLRGL